MAKHTITFDSIDEREELKIFLHAPDLCSTLTDISNMFRALRKTDRWPNNTEISEQELDTIDKISSIFVSLLQENDVLDLI